MHAINSASVTSQPVAIGIAWVSMSTDFRAARQNHVSSFDPLRHNRK